MDHLPKIKDAAFAPSPIPYLCDRRPYDGPTLSGFREKNGWTIIRSTTAPYLARTDSSVESAQETTAFLQSWMYFGFLTELFKAVGVEVDQADFVIFENGSTVITTALLPEYIDRWAASTRDCSPMLRVQQLQKATQIIHESGQLAQSMLTRGYVTFGHNIFEDCPTSRLVVLSIMVLGDSLETARSRIYNFYQQLPNPQFYEPRRPYGGRSITTDELFSRGGWCPSTQRALGSHASIDSIAYHIAAHLKATTASTDHASCSTTTCIAMQVNTETYKKLHISPDCTCSFIAIDKSEVSVILNRSGVPCIEISAIDHQDHNNIQAVVVNSNDVPFIAISHVWSHGLGNPRHNALPRCQLMKLRQLVSSFIRYRQWAEPMKPTSLLVPKSDQRVYIWIDTLCVPVGGEYREARNLAIARMADTYKRASATLVLDSALQASSYDCSLLERQLRILTCDWMRRLWTLQEAVLSGAKRLWFQFKERAISFYELQNDSSLYYAQQAYVAIFGRIPFNLSDNSKERPEFLYQTVAAMAYRSTSRQSDETVCISSMLGLDVAPLLTTGDPVERMKIFMSQMSLAGQIPSHLIFMTGERLQEEGCRWIPRTFFSDDSIKSFGHSVLRSRISHFDSRGLYVTYPGIILNLPKNQILFPEFGFHNPFDGSWCQIVPLITNLENKREKQQWNSWLHCFTELKDCPSRAIIFDSIDGSFQIGGTGVLVDIQQEDSEVLFVRFMCRFRLFVKIPSGATTSDTNSQVLEMREELERSLRVNYGPDSDHSIPSDSILILSKANGTLRESRVSQRWCVG